MKNGAVMRNFSRKRPYTVFVPRKDAVRIDLKEGVFMNRTYSTLPLLQTNKAWAEVSYDALLQNYRLISRMVKEKNRDARIIAVVKADGYCHSNEICVPAFLEGGCDFFAVSSLEEAVAVREIAARSGSHPDVLVLGYTLPSQAETLARYDIIQGLISYEYAKALSKALSGTGYAVRVHVKVDTGMNRVGFLAHTRAEIENAVLEIERAVSLPSISAEGIFSHFARADEDFSDGSDEDLNCVQLERFKAVTDALRARGVSFSMRHVCNGIAAIRFPDEYLLDGVRVGLPLYGAGIPELCGVLRPTIRLKSVVAHLHPLLPGEGVGYGSTYRASEERVLATLPIGYADGFLRAYHDGSVVVHTRNGDAAAPIVGRICMDQCMIDVTGLSVSVGDEVTLIGGDSVGTLALAERGGTIEHEVLCTISSRVPRIRV